MNKKALSFAVFTLLGIGAASGNPPPPSPPPTPNPPPLSVPAISKPLVFACSGCNEGDFSLGDHVELTNEMVSSGELRNEYLQQMRNAMYWQDIYHQFESKAHFDNCAFDLSIAYVKALLDEVGVHAASMSGASPKNAKDSGLKAFFALGQALHAVQDFYAHSNYIELHVAEGTSYEKLRIPGVWTEEGAKAIKELEGKGLVTGRVWWGTPKLCKDGAPDHGALNKDSATSVSGAIKIPIWGNATQYSAARRMALETSKELLSFSYKKWPALKDLGGKWVAFDVFQDRRDLTGEIDGSQP